MDVFGFAVALGTQADPVGRVCLGVASEKNRDVPIEGGGRGGHDEKRPGVFHAEKGTAS